MGTNFDKLNKAAASLVGTGPEMLGEAIARCEAVGETGWSLLSLNPASYWETVRVWDGCAATKLLRRTKSVRIRSAAIGSVESNGG